MVWSDTAPTYFTVTRKLFGSLGGLANKVMPWKSPATVLAALSPAQGLVAFVVGAMSFQNPTFEVAVCTLVYTSYRWPRPPVIVTVAAAGWNDAGPLKSIACGSELLKARFRLRNMTARFGAWPGVVRVPKKSTRPLCTSWNTTGFCEAAPSKIAPDPPNATTPYCPAGTPTTVPLTVFVGNDRAHDCAAS